MTSNVSPAPSLTVDQALANAIVHHQAGRLAEAEQLYRAALVLPNHPDANHNLGVLAVQVKQVDAALPYFKTALEANPTQSQYWFSYIDALIQAGQTDDARVVLAQGRQRGLQGQAIDDATERLKLSGQQVANKGGQPLHLGIGQHEIENLTSLLASGRYAAAVPLARTMTERFPYNGFGWKVLGAALKAMGRVADALPANQMAAILSPGDAEVLGNLAATFHDLGRLVDAEASYKQALEIKPDYVDALNNYTLLLNAQGKPIDALNMIKKSLLVNETGQAKGIFVDCVKALRWNQDAGEIRTLMVRALTEPWTRPSVLARSCLSLVKTNPSIGGCITRAANAWPKRLSAQDLFTSNGLEKISADTLLCTLLKSAPNTDGGMERFLTMSRHAMLAAATKKMPSDVQLRKVLNFYCALAYQCFINEYVFPCTDDEIVCAGKLRDSLVAALEAKTNVPILWLVTVAAYFPLGSLPLAARLLDAQWGLMGPEAVMPLLIQQIYEPAEELLERAGGGVTQLTQINDEVSLLVQEQYEENPYPRWIKAAPSGQPRHIAELLGQKFPLSSVYWRGRTDRTDVLVAGCGTGQHSIDVAKGYSGSHVLAVDLSITSLAYAKRKIRELGITSIETAHADLMLLGSLGRSFDVIEAVGVLHHLADPFAGWRVLLSLLRPGGFMRLGFYSEVARRSIVKARGFIAERGYLANSDDIRRCRQDIMNLDNEWWVGTIMQISDFFTTSECRDLLFHVQEHRMTLSSIKAFLGENNLNFLGFDIDPQSLKAYRKRFPDDMAATNLDSWEVFENVNSGTFAGMYQFWVQRLG